MIGWYEFKCPNCQANCFVDYGDPVDLTGFDPDGFECWNCHNNYKIEPDGELCQVQDGEYLEADMNPALSSQDVEAMKYLLQDLKSDDPPDWVNGVFGWLLKKITGLS